LNYVPSPCTKFNFLVVAIGPHNSQPITLKALAHVRHRRFDFWTSIPPSPTVLATSNHRMASAKPLTMLVARSRPTARLSSVVRPLAHPSSPQAAFLTSTLRAYATPSGPPPPGFRLPKPERWDESKESAMDKAGKYFLLTEMARGMYVVLEQFFRPP
jgi:hypothetical protein